MPLIACAVHPKAHQPSTGPQSEQLPKKADTGNPQNMRANNKDTSCVTRDQTFRQYRRGHAAAAKPV